MSRKEATIEFEMFDEVIRHTRMSKTNLCMLLSNYKDIQCYKGMSFADIYSSVHRTVLEHGIKGAGPLAKYDIVSAICRYHRINFDYVYIVGAGPKKALAKLNLKPKRHRFNTISLPYVSVDEVKSALCRLGQPLLQSSNGDDYESYLCQWQKTFTI